MFSFAARKKTVDFQPFMRRICDLTTPNNGLSGVLPRNQNRYNRAIPTLLCQWERNRPVLDKTLIVLTKDVSDSGIGVIMTHPFEAEQVATGFCLPGELEKEPCFFLGNVIREVAIGGGFWLMGIELSEHMNKRHGAELEPLFTMAKKLLPPCEPELATGSQAPTSAPVSG